MKSKLKFFFSLILLFLHLGIGQAFAANEIEKSLEARPLTVIEENLPGRTPKVSVWQHPYVSLPLHIASHALLFAGAFAIVKGGIQFLTSAANHFSPPGTYVVTDSSLGGYEFTFRPEPAPAMQFQLNARDELHSKAMQAALVIGAGAGIFKYQHARFSVANLDKALTKVSPLIREILSIGVEPISKEKIEQVEQVFFSVLAEAKALYPQANDMNWDLVVRDNKEIREASTLPGGFIEVTSSMLDLLENEPALAFVLAHEIGHAVMQHSASRMVFDRKIKVGLQIASGALAFINVIPAAFMYWGEGYLRDLARLAWRRLNEFEADQIGIVLMARAGYDPREAIDWFGRLSEVSDQLIGDILSSHPATHKRQTKLRAYLPQVLPIYEAAEQHVGIDAKLIWKE